MAPESRAPRRILIDGRSGSGKTELAQSIVETWPGAQLVRLDDIYPGWDGLAAASAAVPAILLDQRWLAWDWETGMPGGSHALDPARPVVIEGVGALSRASRQLADAALWVELDAATRRRRALDRDGAYAPFWDRWAAQEDAFIAREQPQLLADAIIDGSSAPAALRVARVALEA